MIPGSNNDDLLGTWLEDGPTNAPGQLLETVLEAVPSIPQRRAGGLGPWRRSAAFGFARALAGAAIVVGLGFAAMFVLRPAPGGTGEQASRLPAAMASPTPATPTMPPASTPPPSETTAPSPSPSPAPTPAPTSEPTSAPCEPARLIASITLWEGAAGHRIANVELKNDGSRACTVAAMAKPQLVDGNGSVLIDGTEPTSSATLIIQPGERLKTLVQDTNYCGPAPAAPVSVAFVFRNGDRIVGTPVSPTDATVPPCLGSPGSAGDIEMHPWAP